MPYKKIAKIYQHQINKKIIINLTSLLIGDRNRICKKNVAQGLSGRNYSDDKNFYLFNLMGMFPPTIGWWVSVCPEMVFLPNLFVMLKKIILGISHICLRLFFSACLDLEQKTSFLDRHSLAFLFCLHRKVSERRSIHGEFSPIKNLNYRDWKYDQT